VTDRITSTYEHALQAAYYDIGNRGICVNTDRIAEAKVIVKAEIARNLAIAANQWSCKVFVGAANAPDDPAPGATGVGAINLNATQGKYALLAGLKNLGYDVVKITKKDSEGNYEQSYSTGELALQKMLSKNQFNYPGGDPAIRAILKIRELGKLYSSYLNARLLVRGGEGTFFLTNYNVAGTLTGRRSSRRHTFGFGNNAQNVPKHSDIAQLYRKCLTCRPGNIFLMVDQISAEDWPVSALSGNTKALEELRGGIVDRHSKLASAIFGMRIPGKNEPDWDSSKYDEYRYLGKKVRHATNYDMKGSRMTDALAQEGKSYSEAQCNLLIAAAAASDPSIRGVFHKYIQDTINRTRTLVTPFGRERTFLGARPNDSNSTLFKEAYAYIPQSTVGDNTGFALLSLCTTYPETRGYIVQEGHDSIVQDVPEDVETVYKMLLRTCKAFDRTIRFYNGIEVNIPIEAEVGFDFNTTVKVKEFTRAGIKAAIEKSKENC
jgi:hypothetical protein